MENVPEVFLKHSDPEHSFSRSDLLDQVLGYVAVEIDDVIGDIALALVDHVGDVDLVVGHEVRDSLDHAGLVLVRNGEPLFARPVE